MSHDISFYLRVERLHLLQANVDLRVARFNRVFHSAVLVCQRRMQCTET